MIERAKAEQLVLDLPYRPARGMDDFLIAESNKDAVDWLDRWPDWPAGMLALHGPAGSGKSHLAHVFATQTGAKIMRQGDLTRLDLATVDPRALVVEDCDRIADEEALLHLYNWVREHDGTLLLTCRQPPARWPVKLPDLASRLTTIFVVALGPPDESLLAAVLVKLLRDYQAPAKREVVGYVVPRIGRSFAAVQEFAAVANRLSLRYQRPITVPLAREALAAVEGPVEET